MRPVASSTTSGRQRTFPSSGRAQPGACGVHAVTGLSGEPLKVHLEDQRGDGGWHAFRRLVRSYAVAKARSKGDVSATIYARAMLKANRRDLAECRGVVLGAARRG